MCFIQNDDNIYSLYCQSKAYYSSTVTWWTFDLLNNEVLLEQNKLKLISAKQMQLLHTVYFIQNYERTLNLYQRRSFF